MKMKNTFKINSPYNVEKMRVLRKEHNRDMKRSLRKDDKIRNKSRSKRIRAELSEDSTDGKVYDKSHGGKIYSVIKPNPEILQAKTTTGLVTPKKMMTRKSRDSGVCSTHCSTGYNYLEYSNPSNFFPSSQNTRVKEKSWKFQEQAIDFQIPSLVMEENNEDISSSKNREIEDPEQFTFRDEKTRETINMRLQGIFNHATPQEQMEEVNEYFNHGRGIDLADELDQIEIEEDLPDEIARYNAEIPGTCDLESITSSQRQRREFYRANLRNSQFFTPPRSVTKPSFKQERPVRINELTCLSSDSNLSVQKNDNEEMKSNSDLSIDSSYDEQIKKVMEAYDKGLDNAPKVDRCRYLSKQDTKVVQIEDYYDMNSSEDGGQEESPLCIAFDFEESLSNNKSEFKDKRFKMTKLDSFPRNSFEKLAATDFATPEKKSERQDYYNKRYLPITLGQKFRSPSPNSPKSPSKYNDSLLKAPFRNVQQITPYLLYNPKPSYHRDLSHDKAKLTNNITEVDLDLVNSQEIGDGSHFSNSKLGGLSSECSPSRYLPFTNTKTLSKRGRSEEDPREQCLGVEEKLMRLRL